MWLSSTSAPVKTAAVEVGKLTAVSVVEGVWSNRSDNPELSAVISYPKDTSGTFSYKVSKETLDCMLPVNIVFAVAESHNHRSI